MKNAELVEDRRRKRRPGDGGSMKTESKRSAFYHSAFCILHSAFYS